MSYIQSSLSSDEQIKHTFGFHWLIWAPAATFGLITFVLFAIGASGNSDFLGFGLILAIWTMLYSLYKYVDIRTSERGVTCKRIVAKEGILSTRSNELRLYEVESVNLYQNLPEKLFGSGSLILSGTGNKRVTLSSLEDPFLSKRKIENLLESAPSLNRARN